MSTAKPQLHGLLRSYLRKHIALACVCGVVGAVAWKLLVAEPRKRSYAEFYKTYDAAADNERMTKLGLFQSKQG
uniref:Putative cytochrome c oxidase subunit vic n=1 Tax=Ornithodoros turicata TaxID=34597 RepID=A0A2R5LF95_9ACAR